MGLDLRAYSGFEVYLGFYGWIGCRSMLVGGRSRFDEDRSRSSVMDGGDHRGWFWEWRRLDVLHWCLGCGLELDLGFQRWDESRFDGNMRWEDENKRERDGEYPEEERR